MDDYIFGLHKFYNTHLKPGRISVPDNFIPQDEERRRLLANVSAFLPANVFVVEKFDYDCLRIDVGHICITEQNGKAVPKLMVIEEVGYEGEEDGEIDIIRRKSLPAERCFAFSTQTVGIKDYFHGSEGLSSQEYTLLRRAFSSAADFYPLNEEGDGWREAEEENMPALIWQTLDKETVKADLPDRLLFAGMTRTGANEVTLLFVKVWRQPDICSLLPGYRNGGFYLFAELEAHCPLAMVYQDLLFHIEQVMGLKQAFDIPPNEARTLQQIEAVRKAVHMEFANALPKGVEALPPGKGPADDIPPSDQGVDWDKLLSYSLEEEKQPAAAESSGQGKNLGATAVQTEEKPPVEIIEGVARSGIDEESFERIKEMVESFKRPEEEAQQIAASFKPKENRLPVLQAKPKEPEPQPETVPETKDYEILRHEKHIRHVPVVL